MLYGGGWLVYKCKTTRTTKAESLLDANIAKSLVSYLLILTDDWGV